MKQRERLLEAAFGAFDGAAGAAGLVAGAIAAGVSPKGLLIVGVGSAVANALSMAGDDRDAGKSWVLAVAMLVGTLVGALVPVLPVVLVPGVGGIADGCSARASRPSLPRLRWPWPRCSSSAP